MNQVKDCKYDDRCIFDKAAANSPTSPGSVCATASTQLNPDVCRGIQMKHKAGATALISANGIAGFQKKKARCESSSSPQFVNGTASTVPCGCLRGGKKPCKACVPTVALVPCVNVTGGCPLDPGTGGDSAPGPSPAPGGDFLLNNTMTMQGGAVKYTPSVNNGNWTVLCQIPQQAKAIAFGADQTPAGSSTVTPDSAYILNVWTGAEPVPGLADLYASKPTSYDSAVLNTPYFMAGTRYFDNATSWYVGGLPKTTAGVSTGGMAPSGYVGTGKDFLDNYFRSAVQNPPNTKALSGSTSGSANAQIFMKTSAYWVAVTHVMYNLDMAEKNIAANNTAAAKANFDSVAAAYYGCGDTNPVPLPTYNGAQLTYSTVASTPDTGFNATTMSIYGVANKRADNYGTAGLVSTNTVSCSGTTVPTATCKAVAALNVEVAAALNAGPTVANADIVRDATLTIFTQAAQRYAAKLTLAAQLPGDGMGGSTYFDQLTSTTRLGAGSYIPESIGSTAATKMQTACGQRASFVFQTNRAATAGATAGTAGISTANQVSGVNSCGASALVGTKGSPASNTATFGSVMAQITSPATGAAAPGATTSTLYSVLSTLAYAADVEASTGGSLPTDIIKATRGLPSSSGDPAGTVPPMACIGPSVKFGSATGILNKGSAADDAAAAAAKAAVSLCNPQGKLPPAGVAAAATLADRRLAYAANAAAGAALGEVEFWDPITAALITEGAFCCDALIYSADGLGMKASGVTGASNVRAPSTFVPPFVGGDMSAVASASPGGMCPVSGNNILGLSEYASPTEVNLLEGQAFYAVIAPMQYTMQKTSTVVTTQANNAAKQKVCAETLTKMYKVNQTPATTATNTAGCANPNGLATPAAGSARVVDLTGPTNCRGSDVNAINYPIWKVKIGSAVAGTGGIDYFVPNAYCYANACFEDFATVGLNSSFKGATKLAALVKSPDMSSNPTTVGTAPLATGACGRANKACAAPPASWTGGAAEFVLCPITNVAAGTTTCTTAQQEAQMGRLPSST